MPRIAKNPAVDPTLPKVSMTLNGEEYFLCFTFGALASAEAKLRKLGIEANLLRALDLSNLDATHLVPLLYAALITHKPDISPEQVAKMVRLQDIPAIFQALAKAYVESLAEPEKDKKSRPSEPQAE
jgi:hypothetical protein